MEPAGSPHRGHASGLPAEPEGGRQELIAAEATRCTAVENGNEQGPDSASDGFHTTHGLAMGGGNRSGND